MAKRSRDSLIEYASKKQKSEVADKLQCIFPVPQWLKENDDMGRIAFMTYGRYQPAHTGHKAVFDKLVNMSREDKIKSGNENSNWESSDGRIASNVFVFASPTVDKPKSIRKNSSSVKPGRYPLHPNLKTRLMEEQTSLYEKPSINVINMAATKHNVNGRRDPAAALKLLLACYNNVVMLVGSDRVKDFAWLGTNPRVTILSAGERDEKDDGIMGMSGTKLRNAVMRGDYEAAKRGMSYGAVTDNTLDTVIESLRSAMAGRGGRSCRRKTRNANRMTGKKVIRKKTMRNKNSRRK
jgi:hypothetical protein